MNTYLPLGVGCVCAFAAATATILYDCHLSVEALVKRVPIPVYKSREMLLLAGCCGIAAVLVFWWRSPAYEAGAFLQANTANPVLRGVAVGFGIIALIRSQPVSNASKRWSVEPVYLKGRDVAVEKYWLRWAAFKRRFREHRIPAAMRSGPVFEGHVIQAISEALEIKNKKYATFVHKQLSAVQSRRPSAPFSAQNPEWQKYYGFLTDLALESVGPAYVDLALTEAYS